MLIGIAGKAKSGKDTVGDFLVDEVGIVARISFAEPLKRGLLAMFSAYGVTEKQCFGPSEMRSVQIGDMCFDDTKEPITVRHALQTLGTEWGRNKLYNNVWVDLGITRAKQVLQTGVAKLVIITDVRFENEMKVIRDAGGELWHVDRPDGGLEGKAALHASEMYSVPPADTNKKFVLEELRTEYIKNDGTLNDLRGKVSAALDRTKLRAQGES